MGCCLLATLFVGGIWSRSAEEIESLGPSGRRFGGLAATASSLARLLGPRWRWWLVLLAALELVVAALVAWVLVRAVAGDGTVDGPAEHSGMTGMTDATAGGAAVPGWLLVATPVALILAAVTALAAGRRPALLAASGFVALGVVVASLLLAGPAVPHSQWMSQLMICGVAAPVVLARATALTRNGPLLPDRIVRVGGPVAALLLTGAVFAWHLPGPHGWLMAGVGRTATALAAVTVVGLVCWGLLLNDERPELSRSRRAGLLLLGVPSGLLGLALLVATGPVLPAMGGTALDALTDQRLAGLIMMLGDLAFVVPALERTLAGGRPAVRPA